MSLGKDVDLDEVFNKAFELEKRYGGCTQAVLTTLQEYFPRISDDTITSAYSLAGGSGLSCKGTCGALVGGLMAISSLYGRPKEGFGNEREYRQAYRISIKLVKRFEKEYGSIRCCDIQEKIFGRSFDLMTREGNIELDKAGGHEDKCTTVAGNGARWAMKILKEVEDG
ncbi:MAG: C-GCAxxG-C-C family protein [Candidatus Thermoplasmatota archaeon]|nr:C-GCAxxG-C-C family protein [Candidatus Thermoplasmatota archaeon]